MKRLTYMTAEGGRKNIYDFPNVSAYRVRQFVSNMKRDKRKVFKDEKFLRALKKRMYQPGKADELISFIEQDTSSEENGIQWCQGIYSYAKQIENIDEFSVQIRKPLGGNSANGNPHYRKALDLYNHKYLNGVRVRPYRYTSDVDIYHSLPKKDAHAGFLYFQNGKKTKEENVEGALTLLKSHKINLLSGVVKPEDFPILPQSRCQSNPPISDEGEFLYDAEVKHKTRLIHMIDFRNYMFMNEFQIPWQTAFSNLTWYAGGYDNSWLHQRIEQMSLRYPYFWVLDASKFDAHLQSWLMYDVRMVEKQHFILNSEEERLYDIATDGLIYKTIFDGDRIRRLEGGMGSGFPWTSTGDSALNLVQVATALFAHDFQSDDFDFLVMGDDILIFSVREFSESLQMSVQSYLWHNFAYKINLEKANSGKFSSRIRPEFLSRYWMPEGPRRNWRQTVAKAVFPERYRKYSRKNHCSPELVIWSLCLLYPRDMEEIMDVGKFMASCNFSDADLRKAAEINALPGATAYEVRYGVKKKSQQRRVLRI